jgi:hypothetical protein
MTLAEMESAGQAPPLRDRPEGDKPREATGILEITSALYARGKKHNAALRGLAVETRDLGDGDVSAEVDVLDGVKELDAFAHGALEGLAT